MPDETIDSWGSLKHDANAYAPICQQHEAWSLMCEISPANSYGYWGHDQYSRPLFMTPGLFLFRCSGELDQQGLPSRFRSWYPEIYNTQLIDTGRHNIYIYLSFYHQCRGAMWYLSNMAMSTCFSVQELDGNFFESFTALSWRQENKRLRAQTEVRFTLLIGN